MRLQTAAILLLAARGARGLEHGTISTASQTCQQQYEQILVASYQQPTLDGAYNCSEVIQTSFASQDGQGCFAYDIMIGCFQVSWCKHSSCPATHTHTGQMTPCCCAQISIAEWNSFVQQCNAIFSAAPNCVEQSIAWADCSRPAAGTDVYVVGTNELGSKFTVDTFSDDTGYLDNAGPGWQSRFYTGTVRALCLPSCECSVL